MLPYILAKIYRIKKFEQTLLKSKRAIMETYMHLSYESNFIRFFEKKANTNVWAQSLQ